MRRHIGGHTGSRKLCGHSESRTEEKVGAANQSDPFLDFYKFGSSLQIWLVQFYSSWKSGSSPLLRRCENLCAWKQNVCVSVRYSIIFILGPFLLPSNSPGKTRDDFSAADLANKMKPK
jgi:hypothetical protein